ncbi:topology modulation protein [Salipaludibacillus sp. HK11]|uniref:topology modulation protein n=1 Tax=Salipaludibacillus sp. HK11 TaxID=3394320 RepID=UPI0039FD5C7B
MNKIMVVGVSAGVGKSTFAKKLSENLSIPVYHLDRYFWEPGWIEAPPEIFANIQLSLVKQDNWIIEGNYGSTFEIRADKADTIIYLELPLSVCLYRVLKRWLSNIGNNRDDMGEGCPEKMDWVFLSFIIKTYYERKKTMSIRLTEFEQSSKNRTVYRLTNKREISNYTKNLNN